VGGAGPGSQEVGNAQGQGDPSDEQDSEQGPSEPPPETGLSITRPESGAVVGHTNVRVEGVTALADGTVVEVDGIETTVSGGTFVVPVELDEGVHTVEASAAGHSETVEFRVDATPPELVIESPQQAAFIDGRVLEIRGYVEDATRAEVTIGDETVLVGSGGRFSVEQEVQPGAHRRRIVATDAAGHTDYAFRSALVGDFASPGDSTPNAVALELGSEALSELARGLGDQLSRVDLEQVVRARNPVASGWWGELNVTGVSHDGIDIEITPHSGRIDPRIVVDNLQVDMKADWAYVGATGAEVYADPEMNAGVALGVEGGLPDVGLDGVKADLHGFRFDIDWIPSWFEDWETVRGAARRYIEGRLQRFVEQELPPKLRDALRDLPAGRRVSFQGGSFDVGVELSALDADESGMWATVDVRATAASGGLSSGSATGPLVLPTAESPSYQVPEDVAVSVSQNLLNVVLYEAWRERFMERRIEGESLRDEGVTVSDLSLLLPRLEDRAPSDAPVDFAISAALPPVVRESDGELWVEAADVRAELVARGGGEDVPLMTLSLGARTRVTSEVREDAFSVNLEGIELTGVDVVGDAKDQLPDGDELQELLLSLLGDRLEDGMEIDALQIPSLYGFEVTAEQPSPEDGYLALTGSLHYRD
jgi:hypothetical protein